MFGLELAVVAVMMIIGARYGGIFFGMAGGLGLGILILVFKLPPSSPPIDVMLIMLAVVVAASTLQAAGGMQYLIRLAEYLLRKNPKRITTVAPFVAGATGYIARRLVPRLVQRGHEVRTLVRTLGKAAITGCDRCETVQGDLVRKESLERAFEGIDVAYYLVHSMAAGEAEFERRDRLAAHNVADVASQGGVKRIIYLGGLGRKDIPQSAHLKSRHEGGSILRSGSVPVTEFRAAVIVGSGSVSFEMMHHLVNRLPVMICPRWVTVKTQPIGVRDVLSYVVDAVEKPRARVSRSISAAPKSSPIAR